MNINFSFLVGPIVGGIIGLITNGIAIRMLFRPLHPVKIGRFTLPFTPGIIPKEKERIAKSCGNVVGVTLINEEVLAANLLSADMDQKIEETISEMVEKYKDSELSIYDILCNTFELETTQKNIKSLQETLIHVLYEKACGLHLGDSVATAAMVEVQKNPLYDTFSFLISDDAVSGMKIKISEMVDDMIRDNGQELIAEAIIKESNTMLDLKMNDLYKRYNHKLDDVTRVILDTYHNLVTKSLAKILNAIDIPKLVEDRINSFDMLELEQIILGIMKKELNAIVWLGGLLGLLMGFIMNFV